MTRVHEVHESPLHKFTSIIVKCSRIPLNFYFCIRNARTLFSILISKSNTCKFFHGILHHSLVSSHIFSLIIVVTEMRSSMVVFIILSSSIIHLCFIIHYSLHSFPNHLFLSECIHWRLNFLRRSQHARHWRGYEKWRTARRSIHRSELYPLGFSREGTRLETAYRMYCE